MTGYDIAGGRGYRDAERILGEGFAGVIERDGWAPCRKFTGAAHQTCLAHLLRRCSELLGDAVAGQARSACAARILLDALSVREAGLDDAALADRVAGLQARIDRFCARTPTHDPNRKLVAHVAREPDHLLAFLTHEGVAATNWRAEQALRGMICNRKHWGGNKTRAGADTAAVIASVLRTSRQQGVDPIDVLVDIQRTATRAATTRPGSPGRWAVAVTPRIRPRPGVRYRVVVTGENIDDVDDTDDDLDDVVFDHTGDAFVVGVAALSGTRITAEVNHDGDQFLRERLTVYITNAVLEP